MTPKPVVPLLDHVGVRAPREDLEEVAAALRRHSLLVRPLMDVELDVQPMAIPELGWDD